jgi:hypothetical protein
VRSKLKIERRRSGRERTNSRRTSKSLKMRRKITKVSTMQVSRRGFSLFQAYKCADFDEYLF